MVTADSADVGLTELSGVLGRATITDPAAEIGVDVPADPAHAPHNAMHVTALAITERCTPRVDGGRDVNPAPPSHTSWMQQLAQPLT